MEGIMMEVLDEKVLNAEIEQITKIWPIVSKVVSVIHTEKEYDKGKWKE